MFYFKHQILTIIFLFLAVQITSGQSQVVTEIRDVRLENLKKQAELLVEAQNKNDFAKAIELTHPQVIEKVGGKEKLISIIRQVNEQIPKFFESYSLTLENPTVLVELKEKLFGVVPLKVEAITRQKNKVFSTDSIIGVSSDNGTTWKFVRGETFDELFPFAKGKIQIIKQKIFVNGIEQ